MRNLGFDESEQKISDENDEREVVEAEIEIINASADVIVPLTNFRGKFSSWWKNYQWRMRHYFYLHLTLFFFNSLFCALIISIIERAQKIAFIDCWFISSTCVFTCGLQTTDFASFSLASQIILLLFTLISGITVSTIPAILIKIYRIKHERNPASERVREKRITPWLPIRQFLHQISSNPELARALNSLPTAHELRLKSNFILIGLILSTCFFVYLWSFVGLGFWLKFKVDEKLLQSNNSTSINPFYAALVISVTAFNQNGMSLWSSGLTLFVDDVFINIVVMLVVLSGTSLFPAILRSIVEFCKTLSPWKYKIYFDYILLNNHRLSTVIFPSVQTRLFVSITILLQILGVTVAMIVDYQNSILQQFNGGQRFMIFMFQTVNTRFAGYATINIGDLSVATLLIFILLMSVKPQMLCAIDETPFEMEWILLQTHQTLENQVSVGTRRQSIEVLLPFHRMTDFLLRQGSLTKAQAKQYFEVKRKTDRIEETINHLAERKIQHGFNGKNSAISPEKKHRKSHGEISILRMKLFLITFCRHVILSLLSLLSSTRTWLFLFIFLICAFEAPRLIPSNTSITFLRIVFEVVSAFGGCGLSMGSSEINPSLSNILSIPSKIFIILVMCMGRHRGLLDSMKDQEEIEYSAQTIIDSWRQLTIHRYQQFRRTNAHDMYSHAEVSTPASRMSTPPVSTRF